MEWLDLLAVQGTLKSLLQHHSSKTTIFWCSTFFLNFGVQLSHPYMTTGKTIALTRWTYVSKVMSVLLTMVLDKTLESPLDCKEIQPVHPKGDQSWVFIGRKDAEAETPILWPPHVKSWLIGKDSDAGRDWGQKEKGTTEDEMAGWHHWLDGRESEWTLGVGDGQGGLVCCDSWGRRESDMTEWLIWSDLIWVIFPLLVCVFLFSGRWNICL